MKLVFALIIAIGFLGSCVEKKPPVVETIVAKKGPDGMCTEHNVPHDLCTRCNPALEQVFKAKGDWCAEHDFPKSICPVCNPNATPVAKEEPDVVSAKTDDEIEGRVVRFRTAEIEKRAGIAWVEAKQAPGSTLIDCSAELRFNDNAVADVRAIVPGVVRSISVELGQRVEKGDPLFVLESTRIGSIQASLQTTREQVRTARANLARQQELRKNSISSARQVEVAENELAAAEAAERSASSTLRMAGAGKKSTTGRFTLRAPISGEVVRRPAVVGSLATESQPLATVADVSTLWAVCSIPERDANRASVGQTLQIKHAGDVLATGKLTWVSPEVDPRTRTVRARAEVPNDDRKLRANQFLDATIVAGETDVAVMVPRESIQRVEGREVIFVRAKQGMYLPKVVQRSGDGEQVAIRGDVKLGDLVVTAGAVLLRTEVLPNSIGAGCCEVAGDGVK